MASGVGDLVRTHVRHLYLVPADAGVGERQARSVGAHVEGCLLAMSAEPVQADAGDRDGWSAHRATTGANM
jgi:hypothetical protein